MRAYFPHAYSAMANMGDSRDERISRFLLYGLTHFCADTLFDETRCIMRSIDWDEDIHKHYIPEYEPILRKTQRKTLKNMLIRTQFT